MVSIRSAAGSTPSAALFFARAMTYKDYKEAQHPNEPLYFDMEPRTIGHVPGECWSNACVGGSEQRA